MDIKIDVFQITERKGKVWAYAKLSDKTTGTLKHKICVEVKGNGLSEAEIEAALRENIKNQVLRFERREREKAQLKNNLNAGSESLENEITLELADKGGV